MRSILCVLQADADGIRLPKDLHLFNQAMKVLFLVAFGAILFSVIAFAYFQMNERKEWWEVESNVALSSASLVNATMWKVTVAGIAARMDLRNYRVELTEYGTVVDSIDPLRVHTSTQLQFIDLDGDGKLGVGDHFLITCSLAKDYELVIIGRYTGELRGHEEWKT